MIILGAKFRQKEGIIDIDMSASGVSVLSTNLIIVDPDGNTIFSETNIAGLTWGREVDIPIVVGGVDQIRGEYIFNLVVDVDNGQTTYNEVYTYEYDPLLPGVLDTEVFADCFIKKFVVNDKTVYPTGNLIRTVIIQSPVIAGEDDVANVISDDAVTQLSMLRSSGVAYQNVTYTGSVNAFMEVDSQVETSGNLRVNFDTQIDYESVTFSVKVECPDPCSVIDCIDDYVKELDELSCSQGRLTPTQQEDLNALLTDLAMYSHAVNCRDSNMATEYYQKIVAAAGNCECDTDTIRPIPDGNAIYLNGQSAYELWLAQGNSGTEEDFIDSLNIYSDWTDVPASAFNSNFKTHPDRPLRYRISGTHLEFTGAFTLQDGISVPPTGPNYIVLSDFDPGVTLQESAILPVYDFDQNGKQVGAFLRGTLKQWQFREISGAGYDNENENRIEGFMPI